MQIKEDKENAALANRRPYIAYSGACGRILLTLVFREDLMLPAAVYCLHRSFVIYEESIDAHQPKAPRSRRIDIGR